MDDRILKPKQVADLLQVPTTWIYKNKNRLPHFKLGKYIRFRESEIISYLEGLRHV